MTENKPGKSSDDDPVAAQLRFEAALYGDWYSQSILTSYVQEKSSEKSYPKVSEALRPDREPSGNRAQIFNRRSHRSARGLEALPGHHDRGLDRQSREHE